MDSFFLRLEFRAGCCVQCKGPSFLKKNFAEYTFFVRKEVDTRGFSSCFSAAVKLQFMYILFVVTIE